MAEVTAGTSTGDLLARGQALSASGDFAQAINFFEGILRERPSHFLATFERARCHQGLGNWEEAIRGYGEALRLDATELASYVNRGTCRASVADHQGAVEDFERFLEGRPGRADIWTELGDRRLDAGLYARSAEAYERSVTLEPSRSEALAPWIQRAKRLEADRAVGALGEFANACLERGWSKLDAGGPRTAIMWFNRAIDAVPDCGEAWHGRGAARGRLGQMAEANADLEKSVKLSPESAAAWTELGSCRSIQVNLPGALEAVEEAIRRSPDAMRAYLIRGIVRGKLEKWADAESDLSRYVERHAKDAVGWINRGWVRRRGGRPQEAIEDLTRGIELDKSWPLAYYHRGFARRAVGDIALATEDFKKAMSLDSSLKPELLPLVEPAAPTPGPPATASSPPVPVVRSSPPSVPPLGAAATLKPAALRSPAAEWTAKEAVVILFINLALIGLGLLKIPYLSGIPARAVDIPYKAAWIVAHWTDQVAFPHECNLCMEPFCTRTDVTKKYVYGRPHYTSETRWRYCPVHEPGMLRTETRIDGMFMIGYWMLSLLCLAIIVISGTVFAIRLALLPVLGILVISGKLPGPALLPFGAEKEAWLTRFDGVVVVGSFVLGLVMIVMNIVW